MSWIASVASNKSRMYYFSMPPTSMSAEVYYILKVSLINEQKLQQVLKAGEPFEAQNYGDLLYWGYGKLPESVRQEVKQKYKFDPLA